MVAGRNTWLDWFGCPRAQGGMRASPIVKSNEFSKRQPQVPLAEGNEIVQALPSDAPDQSFAEGIRFWGLDGRFQHSHSEIVQRQIERRRKNRVVIVNDEPVRMDVCEDFSELLGGPFRSGMRRDITMQNPP